MGIEPPSARGPAIDWHRISGALLFGILMVTAILFGSSLQVFVHIPSIATVGLGTMALWALQSGSGLGSLRRALRSPAPSVDLLTRGLTAARAGRRATWTMAGLSVAISTIQILQSLDDVSAIGPLIATFLFSPLYACLFDILVASVLERKVVQRALRHTVADRVLDAVTTGTTRNDRHRRTQQRQTGGLSR